MKIENFEIICKQYLNTGGNIFNVGDIEKVISSELINIDSEFKIVVYHTKSDKSLCDFEIKGYFNILN